MNDRKVNTVEEKGVSIKKRECYNENLSTFQEKVEELINKFSLENDSDTPDFILALYLRMCLQVFNIIIEKREEWYGRKTSAQTHRNAPKNDFPMDKVLELTLDDLTPEKFHSFLIKSKEQWENEKEKNKK